MAEPPTPITAKLHASRTVERIEAARAAVVAAASPGDGAGPAVDSQLACFRPPRPGCVEIARWGVTGWWRFALSGTDGTR
jgi:hypothetical protein